ncbi:MAG: efflux RND transporter permease subunit [bacterium]
MWLTKLAITRPVTILMLVLALVVLGLQSRSRLPVDLLPNVEFPLIFISTVYPGTGPEEVETLITKPIEDSVSMISGLKKLSSTSSEGVSSVRLEFEIGTDLETVTSDVRSKIDVLRSTLPQDSKAPQVVKIDIGAQPVIKLSLTSKRLSPIEIRRLAEDVVKDRLGQLTGVASVSITGGELREIQVNVDKNRLRAYGISITQVVNALKAENLNLPSGSVEEALRTSSVRVMGEFTKPEQIELVRISSASNPNLLIRDVAEVKDSVADKTNYTRVNNGSSVAITVQKQSNSNTVAVVDNVRKELERMTGEPYTEESIKSKKKIDTGALVIPKDKAEIFVASDQSIFIKDTMNDVYKALIEGAFLAVLIVFLFLHSLRGTVIVALAIPTSMIATFMVMGALKYSMNMMSMLGLSLAVGILVDDSIVVLENIHRHLQMGESPREAAINGRTEIGLAALAITMVDVVVFVPIAFMGGIVGQFFRQFGIVIASATLFSLFMSFTLTPMLASRWLKKHDEEIADEEKQRENPGLFFRFTQAWERFYQKVSDYYCGILEWSLVHRPVVISVGMMTLLASIATAVSKPNPWSISGLGQLATTLFGALPIIIIALFLIYIVWYAVIYLGGWLRWLYCILLALPLTAAIVVLSSKVLDAKAPGAGLVPMSIAMLALAIIGLMLSFPSSDRQFSRKEDFQIGSSVTRPLVTFTAFLFAVVLLLPTKFGFEFSPNSDQRQLTINIEQSVGTSLGVTNDTAKMIEEQLFDAGKYPEVKSVLTQVGSSGSSGGLSGGASSSADIGSINVDLKDLDESIINKLLISLHLQKAKLRSTSDVVKSLNTTFGDRPGVKISAAAVSSMGGGGSSAPISIEVSGQDEARSLVVANQIKDIVKTTTGTYSVDLSWKSGRPELQAHIDRDRAAQYGISVAAIASALRTSMEGDITTKYRENGKEYDIRVQLPTNQREVLTQVPDMVVGTTATGQPVRLYEVCDLQPASGPTKVERTNRQRSVTVQGYLEDGYQIGNIQAEIKGKIAAANIDTTGVTVNWAGQAQQLSESFSDLGSALILSVLLVFMLMAALFESVLAPLIIMLSVPQAMAGAIFAMTITHKSLSIMTMIGLIMLVGLVTKNAILMVDYTNTLRKQGLDRESAIKQAGPVRLRPILMTTMAMIFGMLPTAIALSKGSEMRQPLAIAVIGGLLLSMFLTLLMVPVFYEIVDDVSTGFSSWWKSLWRKE